jgi:hypothetical protein
MDDALLVRGIERLRHLPRDRERVNEGYRSPRDPIGQGWSLDQLHHQRRHARVLLESVNMRDIRVTQCREDFRLTLESGESLRIAGDRRWKHFDGDRALQVGVRRSIHLSHAARSEVGDDLIRTKTGTER